MDWICEARRDGYILWLSWRYYYSHRNGVIMSTMASQITSHMIVYSTVYSRPRSKRISKLRVTGLCAGNSPVTGEFPAQRASNAEKVSIWWRHHAQNTQKRREQVFFNIVRVQDWLTRRYIYSRTLFRWLCLDMFVCINTFYSCMTRGFMAVKETPLTKR